MILQSLNSLYDRLKDDKDYQIASPGYSLQKISFKVVIKPDGKLFDLQDARITDGSKMLPQQKMVIGDNKSPGSGLNPCFLWDNGGYMLGYKPIDKLLPASEQKKQRKRLRQAFNTFKKEHLALESEINCPEFSAVCRFLESWNPKRVADYPVLKDVSTGFGLFQIVGKTRYVHEEIRINRWWEGKLKNAEKGDVSGQCLLTGEYSEIARLQPKIKGIGEKAAPIVGFNEAAYESYGKTQAFNAPVGSAAAFRYGTALNALTNGPMRSKHLFRLADTSVVFWTDRPAFTENIFVEIVTYGSLPLTSDEAQDEDLRQKLELFFHALKKGKKAYAELDSDPDQTKFFILGLAPNAARISIRFFHQSTISELLENLHKHFSDIRVERQFDENSKRPDPEFPPLWMLLRQTARESKEIPPVLSGPLLRAIITGVQYPQGLYAAVIRRINADRLINYSRACVIKGYLTRNIKMEVEMSLDEKRKDPAYRAGRLFAVLEKTQKDALGDVGSTVRDRFYSSASATPRSVFPRLLRTYQHHLSKLQPGVKINREKLMQQILDTLENFPAHLNLAEQGLFALGYYHQTHAFYSSKKEESLEEETEIN